MHLEIDLHSFTLANQVGFDIDPVMAESSIRLTGDISSTPYPTNTFSVIRKEQQFTHYGDQKKNFMLYLIYQSHEKQPFPVVL